MAHKLPPLPPVDPQCSSKHKAHSLVSAPERILFHATHLQSGFWFQGFYQDSGSSGGAIRSSAESDPPAGSRSG